MTDYQDITPAELEGKISVQLHHDETAENPRSSWDHAGTLYIDSRDYDLTDNGADLPYTPNSRWESDTAFLVRFAERCVRLAGGVAIPVRFSDYGSSGAGIHECDADDANGLIWIEADKIAAEWTDHGTPTPKLAARACLESEISELDDWLQGNVFGYVVETPDGEHLDSCWGFYGETYATTEGVEAGQREAKAIDKRAQALTAARGWAFSRIFGRTPTIEIPWHERTCAECGHTEDRYVHDRVCSCCGTIESGSVV